MTAAFATMLALPGLAIGSFLNVVASRVPVHMPIGTTRSECLSCHAEIAWYDNVPLLSYILLRGRCRSCAASIPARYPLVEGASAALVAACVVAFGVTPYALLASAFCLVLVVLAAIDVEHRIVPNRIVVPAAAVLLVAHTLLDVSPEWVLAAFAASAFLLTIALIKPNGMGMGDVKLCLLLGAMLGRNVAVAIAVAIVLGVLPAAVAVARGRSTKGMTVPFAPFLALGALVALFWGDALLDAYLATL